MEKINKTKLLRTPMTPTEFEVTKQLAERELLSRAELVRALVRKAAAEAGLWPPKDPHDTG